MELPFQDGEERERVDSRRLTHQTRCDRKTEKTMGHGPPEWVGFRGGMVDVEGVEISGESGEQDDIRFCHGPSWALPLIAQDQIIE